MLNTDDLRYHTEIGAGYSKQMMLDKAANEIDQLRIALREAVGLRVALWRNGDFEGDDDKLTDEQVAKKDPYAKKWVAVLPPNAKSQATDAALSRQVACTDGLATGGKNETT